MILDYRAHSAIYTKRSEIGLNLIEDDIDDGVIVQEVQYRCRCANRFIYFAFVESICCILDKL